MIDVCLLGTAGTVPLPDRALASALVRVGGALFLIDCGEGTQVAMRRVGWGFGRLEAILLTHVHADHIAGLPGLLLTLGMSGRTRSLEIVAPTGSLDTVRALLSIVPGLPFAVSLRELHGERDEPAVLGERLTLTALALAHRVPCLAYRFDLARARRFDRARAEELAIPRARWREIGAGRSIVVSGRTISAEQVLGPPRRGLSVAYATDTRPLPTLAPFAAAADLFICEATFMAPEDAERAVTHQHLHLGEAIVLARESRARRVWLTHFSQSIVDPGAYAAEVRAACPTVEIGHDGLIAHLAFDEEEA